MHNHDEQTNTALKSAASEFIQWSKRNKKEQKIEKQRIRDDCADIAETLLTHALRIISTVPEKCVTIGVYEGATD